MPQTLLGLGTSLTDASGKHLVGQNVAFALQHLLHTSSSLAGLPDTQLIAKSALYVTRPWGARQNGAYINGCLLLNTRLPPLKLLRLLQAQEYAQGRRRHRHRWQKRQIDIDILLYGNRVIRHTDLQVPHPWMWQRDFVLLPLYQLVRTTGTVIPWAGRISTANRRLSPEPLTRPHCIYNNE